MITIDRRYLIEEDPADVKAEIDALMRRVQQQRDGFEYEIRDLFEVHPIMTSAESPIAATVATAIEAVLGDRPEFVVSPAPMTRNILTASAGYRIASPMGRAFWNWPINLMSGLASTTCWTVPR